MTHSLNSFKNAFSGGSRANRFRVSHAFPSVLTNLPSLEKGWFNISAASLPKADIGVIAVPYRGRMAYYAGDRQYSVWPIKIYDDNDGLLWKTFNRWKEALDGHITHKVINDEVDHFFLQTTWKIQQLNSNASNVEREIELIRCWPSEIGGINLDMGSSEFVTFDVTLTFDHIKIKEGL
jgi:hypothetical protein